MYLQYIYVLLLVVYITSGDLGTYWNLGASYITVGVSLHAPNVVYIYM